MRKQVLAVTIGVLLVLSVFSVLQFWQIKPAQATVIFSDNFNSGTFGSWSGSDVSAGCSLFANDSTTYKSAPYGANFTIDGNTWYDYACVYKAIDTGTPDLASVYIRQYVYWTVNPATNNTGYHKILILKGYNSSGEWDNNLFLLKVQNIENNARWQIEYRKNGAIVVLNDTTNLTVDTWYNIETYVKIGDSDANVTLFVDSVNTLSDAGFDNLNDAKYLWQLKIGISENYKDAVTLFVDDVVAADSYIGPLASSYGLTINSLPVSVSYSINGSSTGYAVTASSGSAADIQTAANTVYAAGGGTVHVPVGTWHWNNQTVTILGGVNVIGVGLAGCAGHDLNWTTYTASTILHNDAPVQYNTMFYLDGSNGKASRISGIQFEATPPANPTEENNEPGGAIRLYHSINARVDHCTFINFCNTAIILANTNTGTASAVLDHCVVNNPYKLSGSGWSWGYGFYAQGQAPNWETNISKFLGQYPALVAAPCLYVEDNHFSLCRHATDCIQEGWDVVRFNLIDNPQPNNFGMVDVHGAGGGSWSSGRGVEVYNNTIIGAGSMSELMWIRGGGGVIFNNTLKSLRYGIILANETNPSIPWTLPMNVSQLYIWDNTNDSGILLLNSAGGFEDVNYFLRPPSLALDGFDYTPYTYPHPSVVGTEGTTNSTITLDLNVYLVTVPSQVVSGEYTYNFSQWQDTSTNTTITVSLTANTTITATYIDATSVTVSVTSPTNTTYESTSVTVTFTASGGTIDKQWVNLKNGTNWVYASNQTYPFFATFTGLVNGSYTGYFYANNTDGTEGYATVMFSVQVPAYPTVNLVINTWWYGYW